VASVAPRAEPVIESPSFVDLEAPMPSGLERFGAGIRLCLVGPVGAPLVAMLGGISGNRHPVGDCPAETGWWPGLLDRGAHRILGIDFIADERGESAPDTADQARAVAAALDRVGVTRADALVGASYGGMVALAFAACFPERVGRLVMISADAAPHPCATAARELQRRVVRLGLDHGCGAEALAIARGMAMMTYRSTEEFAQRFQGGIDADHPLACSPPGAYLRARGEAFCQIMSPGRFLSLSASIDRHRVAPETVHAPTLLIGAETDQLVLPGQMQWLADRLAGPVDLHMRPSLYGHDMFLKEAAALSPLVSDFIQGRL
jgi:homoserine O-acetyltransferase/O-succinyltransferase